jgi:hypothetical protein
MKMMRWRRYAVCLIVLMALLPTAALALTVRGRIDRLSPYGTYPVAGILVTLGNVRAASGPDGLYYFFNVPAGNWVLTVIPPNSPPMSYTITVTSDPTDVPPIVIP